MVNHVIETAQSLKPKDMVVVIGKNQDQIKDQVAPIAVAVQSPPQGTADAVSVGYEALAQKHGKIEGQVLVLYGDTPLIQAETLSMMIEEAHEVKAAITVLGMYPDDPGAYGRLICDDEGALQKIVEFKEATDEEREVGLCNAGLMLFEADKLKDYLSKIDNKNKKSEFYLTDAIEIAVGQGDHCAVAIGDVDEVIGVNSRVELAEAEVIFQDRQRMKFMHEGVTLRDPATIYFAADTEIGQDTVIEPFVVFGPNVKIGAHCHILSHSHLEGLNAYEHCSIGPFARVRPGTNLGKKVKIGNFVETKKANIKDGSKVSHLTYLGDAEIGHDVNIGAGTITCNYDGTNKFITKIADGAFIGSNSSLVAPTDIGEHAVIGAGSVITEKVESYSLSLARGRQVNKKDYKPRS